jgi:type IV secretion system protein VirB10
MTHQSAFPILLAMTLFAAPLLPGQTEEPTEAPKAETPAAETPAEKSKPEDSRWVVPAQTLIPLTLRNAINSRTAYVGQAIYCQTIYPIAVQNRILIPVGTYVKGKVTEVRQPKRVKGRAQIGVRFDSITLPSGLTQPMRATLSSYAGSGEEGFSREEGRIEGKGSKGEDAGRIATTTAQGTIIGGLGTRTAKGAGVGALAGGAAGLIWVLATKGAHIVLPPGTNFELELTAPLKLEPDDYGTSPRYKDGPSLKGTGQEY